MAGCSQTAITPDVVEVRIGDVVVLAEIADTDEERRRGLMYRRKLSEFQGMWFVFPNEQELRFWMKNTYLPLDIVYVSDDFEIVDVVQSAKPCRKDPCPVYPSKYPARYVLEVNGGFIEKHGIGAGDQVRVVEN